MADIGQMLLPVLFFIMLNGVVVAVTKKKFGTVLPVTLLLSVFLLFYTQFIFHTFLAAYIVLLIAAVTFVPVCLVNRKNAQFMHNFFTEGFMCFVVVCLLLLLADHGKHFSMGDEFAFWGRMTRIMYDSDVFYSEIRSSYNIVHADYPPFAQLFELLWNKLSLGYAEEHSEYGLHVLWMSLIAPYVVEYGMWNEQYKDRYRRIKSFFEIILFNIALILLVLLFNSSALMIFEETIVGMLFAHGMYTVYTGNNDSLFCKLAVALDCAAMILTKQTGLAFACVLLFYSQLEIHMKSRLNFRRRLCSFLLPVVFTAFNYILWNGYTSKLGLSGQFILSNINIKEYIKIAIGITRGFARSVFLNYSNALFTRNILNSEMSIGYITAALCLITALWLIYKLLHTCERRELLNIFASLLIGSVGYALMLSILYQFCFAEWSMEKLSSYERYMGSYLGAEAVFIAMVLSHGIQIRKAKYGTRVVSLMIAITTLSALVPSGLYELVPSPIRKMSAASGSEIAGFLEDSIPEGSSVVLFTEGTEGDTYATGYYAKDYTILGPLERTYELDYSEEDNYNSVIDLISSSNYVYIEKPTDEFNSAFDYLNDNKEFEDRALYKVTDVEDSMSLSKVAERPGELY